MAPDSSKPTIWGMTKADKPFSTDWEHVQASYRYVMSLPRVRKDPRHIVYAGRCADLRADDMLRCISVGLTRR